MPAAPRRSGLIISWRRDQRVRSRSGSAGSGRSGYWKPPAVRLPTLPGVAAYGAPAAQQLRGLVRPDTLRARLVEEVRRVGAGRAPPGRGAGCRLDAVAQDLAVGLRGAQLPPFETVDFLLGHYGLVEPAPNFLLARASADADQEVISQMGVQIAELLQDQPGDQPDCQSGVGVNRTPGGEMAVVVALQERNVVMGAVPRRVNPGDLIPVAGQLLGTHRRPEVIVTAPDGHARELPTSTDVTGVSFRADVRCDQGRGRYQVEVTGVDALGTAVVANFPVFCGVAPPAQPPTAAAGPCPAVDRGRVGSAAAGPGESRPPRGGSAPRRAGPGFIGGGARSQPGHGGPWIRRARLPQHGECPGSGPPQPGSGPRCCWRTWDAPIRPTRSRPA